MLGLNTRFFTGLIESLESFMLEALYHPLSVTYNVSGFNILLRITPSSSAVKRGATFAKIVNLLTVRLDEIARLQLVIFLF